MIILFIITFLLAIAILPGISSAALKDTTTQTVYQTLEDAVTANTGSDILFLISNTSVTLTPSKNIVQFPNTITIQQNKTYTGGKTDKDFIFVNATIGFNGNSQTYTLSPTGSSHFLIFSYDQTGTFQNNSLFEITGNSNTFILGESHPSLITGSFTGTGVNLTGNYNSLNSWIGELEDANGDGYASDLSIVFNLAGSYNSISDAQSCPLNTQASGGIGLKVTGNFNGAPGSASVTSPPTSGETSPPIYIDTSQIYSAPGGKIYIAPSANGNVIRDDNFNLNTQPQIYLSNGTAGTQTTSWYFFNSSWSPSGGNRNLTIDTSQRSFPFGGNVSLVAGISNITGQSTDIIQNSSLFLDTTTDSNSGESSGILKNDTSSLKFSNISAVVPVGMSIGNNTYLDKNGNTVSTSGSLGYVTILDFNPYYSLPGENFNSSQTTDWSSIQDFSAAHNLTFVIENKTSHALLGNISYSEDLNLLTSGIGAGLAVLGNNLAISSTGNSTNFTMTNASLNSVFNNSANLTVYPNNFPFAGYGNITITATTDSGTTTTLFDKGVWLNRAGFVSPAQDVTVIGNTSITLPILHFSKYDFFETTPVANFTGTPTSGNAPLTVQFTDTSTYLPTSWSWSFGDGSTTNSTQENPVHTYSSAGSYTVNLTATNAGGSNTTSIANYINVLAALPIPVFNGTPTSGPEPLNVQFDDTTFATGIQYWNWSFGDGGWSNTTDVTAKNVTHPYTAIGSYTVNLSVTNSSGITSPATVTNTTSIANYINISAGLPVPVFSGAPTSGHAPISVQFNDTTSGTGIQYWNWSFGDATWFNTTSVTAKNATHPYSSAGSFSVSLSVTNSSGLSFPATVTNTTSIANYINASAALPIPAFTSTPTVGHEPQNVQFNDTTLGTGIQYWNWSFGDGGWSNTTDVTAKNVTHTYTAIGSYTVNLSVTNSSGIISPATVANTTSIANYINISAGLPVPVFTGTPTSGHAPLSVQFNDTTLGTGILYWNWSFGDGSPWFNTTDITAKNVTHLYSSAGSYTVNLSVTNSSGLSSPATITNTTSFLNYISVSGPLPVPAFTGSPRSGNATLAVQFNDTTISPGITFWNWSFGDGGWSNTTTAFLRNVTHPYSVQGSYTVSLSVTNSSGTNTTSQAGYIVVGPPLPIPDFTGSPTHGNPPLMVQFNDTSASPGISIWNWSFGDDNAWFNTTDATQRNASHQYSATGTFTVSLTATNTTGINTTSRSGYISTLPSLPIPAFTGSPVSGLAPLFVQFTDTSTSPGITFWNWSFGDGSWFNTTDATQRNANNTYATAGSYTVSLSVTNTSGMNTTTQNGFIIATSSSSSASTTSSASSSASSSVGGSSAVIVSSVSSGQTATFSFNQNPNQVQPVAVTQVQVVPSQNLGTVQVVALPANIGKPLEGTVAGYVFISLVGVNPDAVDHGSITFSVIGEWLSNHNVNPANIVLMREHNNQWTALPTTFDHRDGNYDYFDAATPGFSYFAVVAQSPGTTPGATVKATSSMAETPVTPVVTTVFTTMPTYAIVRHTPAMLSPVTTETVAVPATPVPATSAGIPIIEIAGIAGIVIIIGGIILVRRWWIRRQNPALFRKYD